MHFILLVLTVLLLSWFIQLDLKKLNPVWHQHSLLLLLFTAFITIMGTLLNYWWMWYTKCSLFMHWEWDTVSSLSMGLVLLVMAIGGAFFFVKRQIQSRKLLSVAEKCQDKALLDFVKDFSQRMLLTHTPDLYIGRLNRHFAATFSILNPVILLSTYTIENLDKEELQSVLVHELTHIKQKDLTTSACASLIKDLLWFIPKVQTLFQVFCFSLEIHADKMTALMTKKPGALASALLKFETAGAKEQPRKDLLYLNIPSYSHSAVGFILTEEETSLHQRLEYLLEDHYLAIKPTSLAPWRLKTFVYAFLWLLSLWSFPYCHFLMSLKP
jgi:Zn-dependent protease with chaperone function